jgi:hypothetical protein
MNTNHAGPVVVGCKQLQAQVGVGGGAVRGGEAVS